MKEKYKDLVYNYLESHSFEDIDKYVFADENQDSLSLTSHLFIKKAIEIGID